MNLTINDVGLTEYNVTGLVPYTWYFLWVTASTVSDSPRSHAVSWRTDEGGKLVKSFLTVLLDIVLSSFLIYHCVFIVFFENLNLTLAFLKND